MWLPKDERYLLMVYYVCAPRPSMEGRTFSIDELQQLFIKKRLSIPFVEPREVIKLARLLGDQESAPTRNHNEGQKKEYPKWLEAKQRIEAANTMLMGRDLVETKECGTGFYEIKMKLEGLDLGRKYSSHLIRSGLWFKEYKDHWMWIILGFLAGVIGALFIELLKVLLI